MTDRLMLIIGIMAAYLVAMFAIGLRGRKYADTNHNVMTAAKSGTLLLVTGSYLGSHIGNGVVVGGAQYGAQYGFGGVWYGVGSAFSYILFAIVMAKFIYKKGYITLPDILDERYGSKLAVALVAVLHFAAMIAILAGQIIAGKLLFQYVGLSGEAGAILTMIVVILYSVMAGLWGVMMTDVIQSIIIIAASVLCLGWLVADGGLDVMKATLPASSFDLVPFSSETLIMMFGPGALYGLISAPGWQRTVACKNSRDITRAPLIAAVIIILYAMIPVLFGMYGKALWPEAENSTILFKLLMEKMPAVLGAAVVCSIIAAVMSTSDGLLLSASANVVNDVYLKVIDPSARGDERKIKRLTTMSTVAMGVFGIATALHFTALIPLLSMAYSLLNAGGLVMIMGAAFWDKATAPGAIASFVFGIGAFFLNRFGIITLPYASITTLIPSLIAFVVVSLATQPKGKRA